MEFIAKFRRVGAIIILLVPHIASMLGHPIAGEDVAPLVNGIADLAAAALVAWSKIAKP